MIVAGLQTDIAWEDPAENFRRVREFAGRAREGGAGLLVLPEMFATGFSMNAAPVAAEAAKIRGFASELARVHECHVFAGLAVPGQDRPRNAGLLFDPAGEEVLCYHKIHPFTLAGEDQHYEGGSSVVTHVVGGVRVTPFICYDLRFPEVFRAAAENTDLFLVVANWPSPRRSAWSALLRARAIENQAYVLGVNRVGEGDGLTYSGDSVLLDPMGETQAAAACAPCTFSGVVEASRVEEVRREFGFLADRRPEVYG